MSGQPSALKKQTAKDAVFKLVAVAFGVVLAALVGEVVMRLVMPSRLASAGNERDFFCRFDPELGWAPIENITALHKKNGLSALVHQNQYGLRGSDDMQRKRTDGRRRVLVLGDSYAWGYGVNQNELFSAPEVAGTNVEIINFGVSGYGTDQEYLFYLQRGTNFDVDEVVLALTPYNDVGNNLAPKQYGHLKPFFTLEKQGLVLHNEHVKESIIRNTGSFLNHHSRVWNLLDDVNRALGDYWDKRRKESGTAQAKETTYEAKDVTEQDRKGVELTVAILKKLKEAAAQQHAEFSVIFIPYKPHIDKRLPYNHPLVPLIAEGLSREGITYREPYPEFLKATEAGIDPFNDPDNHFGPKGHALFAKFLTHTDMAEASVNYYEHQ